MKITKRIMSTVLALLMVLSVCSAGFTVSAADTASGVSLKEIDLTPVARPSVEFYCTEVTRIAAGTDSVEPGTQIVKATPSGVPELSGAYASQAYAGETPEATKIVFVSPASGISITGFSCSNSTVTFSEASVTSSGTYTIAITGGTATVGEALVFTIDYTWTDGNTYQEKCVSYVEDIVTGGSYGRMETYFEPYSGTNSYYRNFASASTRLLGKGVYYEQPAEIVTSTETPYRTYGTYNVATGTISENVASGYNTSIYVNSSNPSIVGASGDVSISEFIPGTTLAHVYIDSSALTTLADANLRLDSNVGILSDRNNNNPHTALADTYVYSGSVTTQPSTYTNDATAQETIGLTISEKADYGVKQSSKNSSMTTLTGGAGQYQNLFTTALNGNIANLADGSSYTVIFRYYSYYYADNGILIKSNMTAEMYMPVSMTFHIVDKSALREMVNHVMNSDPDSPLIRNAKKGANPQSWYYGSGFSSFQNAYAEALKTLSNPKALQTEVNSKTKALQSAYNSLVLKNADYTEVNRLYDIADTIVDNEECYPAFDVALVREAQEMVKTGYNILYQSAVDTMAYNLKLAIESAMPYGANYESIYALKLEYEALDFSVYTPETIQAVEDAFAKVDYTLTMLEQDQVEAWAAEIRTAIDNLSAYMADFSTLEATLAEAKAIDRTLYINGSLLLQPMENAEKAVADNAENPWPLSRQSEVDELTATLRAKIDGLIMRSVYKLDLKDAINAEIPGDEAYYDQEILAEYKALVAEGTEMYNDSTLTIYDQKEIDAKTDEITAKYKELMATYVIPMVDTTELEEILAEADAVNLDYYEYDEAIEEFLAAVEEGKEILAAGLELNDENTQTVADSVERIELAIDGLNMKKADTEILLQVLMNATDKLLETLEVVTYIDGVLGAEEKAKYDEAAVFAIMESVSDMVEIIENGGITVDQYGWVEEFANEKQAELDALEALSYTEYLDIAVEEYETVEDSAIYTIETWSDYEASYGVAAAVGAATVQADINAALTDLVNAKNALEFSAYFDKAEGTDTIIDKDLGIIYGLSDEGITDVEDYVEYAGGVVEYEETEQGFGTGTVVNFVVGGEVYASYTVVIFGDLTGDGVVDSYDYAVLAAIINGDIEAEEGSALYLAADIYVDGVVDIYDLSVLSAYVNGDTEITQTPEIVTE